MAPRPRPRPRAKAVSVSPPSPAQCEASTPGARRQRAKKIEDDEDAMFMRNQGRSLKEVNKRAERAAAVALERTSAGAASDAGDEEGCEEETPKQALGKKHKQNMYNTGKVTALPKWAKKGAILHLLEGSDSESENNCPSSYDGTPSKRRRTGASGSNWGTPSGKRGIRARSRSRSRSLTPPPDLTQAEHLRAHQAIQQALSSDQDDFRTFSEEVETEDEGDDPGEGTPLDPELQSIARAIRDRASKRKAGSSDYSGGLQARAGVAYRMPRGGPVNVSVRVKWVAHPEDDAMRDRPQELWLFTMKRHHSFKALFLQTADKAHVLADDLVLMRDGKQVFTSVSPDGLGVWDQVELEACDRITYEALRSQYLRSPTPMQHENDDAGSERGTSAQPSEGSVEPGDEDNKFKLVLRGQGMKEVILNVRPTTTCGKIVRAFLAVVVKNGGNVPASPRKAGKVQLCIDGERQSADTPIVDCELEDGDMVEVVGL